jgi:hypothetical protein
MKCRERPAGLRIKPGRGRKPVYAPHSAAEARSQAETLLHRSPRERRADIRDDEPRLGRWAFAPAASAGG